MKKLFFLFAAMVLSVQAMAQEARFGYFSYDSVFHAMPAYALAEHNVAKLRQQYDAEAKRAEAEFNTKYEEFLDGQKDFAPSILEKRQQELRDLLAKNVAFKEQSAQLLAQAEADAMRPLHAKIAAAVARLGAQKGFAFILNTDGNAVPYVSATLGEDVTNELKLLTR